jgi:hypothetical protein
MAFVSCAPTPLLRDGFTCIAFRAVGMGLFHSEFWNGAEVRHQWP